MANLSFTKNAQTNKYEAVATVSGDFNLHVESKGYVNVYQKTAGEKFDPSFGRNITDGVLDVDVTALVYPKDIKVVCDNQPTVGIITEG